MSRARKATAAVVVGALLWVLASNLWLGETLPRLIVLPVKLPAGTYRLQGTVTVFYLAQLSAEPGVTILAEPGSRLRIFGGLKLEGEEHQPVVVKSAGEDTWKGIQTWRNSGSVKLRWVQLEGAETALEMTHTRAVLEQVRVEGAVQSVRLNHGRLDMSECQILPRVEAPGQNVNSVKVRYGEFRIEKCLVRCPQVAAKVDVIDIGYADGGEVIDNELYGSPVADTDVVDLGRRSRGVLVKGNRIYDTADKGVSVGQSSEVRVEENLLQNCGIGIGAIEGSQVESVDNVFRNDRVALMAAVGDWRPRQTVLRARGSEFLNCDTEVDCDQDSLVAIDP